MDESETITQMYSIFTNIINSLKTLGKIHTQLELVQKILRSLLTTWIHKVSTIEESKDLEKYDIKELIESLMTHEIHIQSLQNKDAFRKKSLVLKVVEENLKDEESSRSSYEESFDEDELAMLSKRI